MNHFTDKKGYNGVQGETWIFHARKQRGDYPFGSYFTTLRPTDLNFWLHVRLPKKKRTYVFEFRDAGDLKPLRGPRGRHVFYSPTDYAVVGERHLYAGLVNPWESAEQTPSSSRRKT